MECAFVGAGAVAEKYATDMSESPLELAAVCDRDADRASRLATAHGATSYTDLDDLLAVETAPLVVNLTSHASHTPVTKRCLEADRHVFSEKPLALDAEQGAALVSIAERRGLALGCAPINHLCEAQQHVRSLLGDGRLGPIRLGYAHAHVGRVTEWHDDPGSFLDVGPLYDGAVYPLNLLVSWFGAAERVRVADALNVWPDRESQSPSGPAHVEATIEFVSGPVIRLTTSLYAPHQSREFNSLELHGDDGSLYLEDCGTFTAEREPVSVHGPERAYVATPRPYPQRDQSYLDGPEHLADAIQRGEQPTVSGHRATQVVAICNAIETAASTGGPISVDDFAVADQTPTMPPLRPVQDDKQVTQFNGTGRTAAIRLPPIGFGCSRYRDGEYVDRIDSIATAIDVGYRLFDSAELYGNEGRIGELLGAPGTPDRDGLFLVSKVWNTNHRHVVEACRGSLDALGVETLDSYLLHWPEAWTYQGRLRNLAEKPPAEQQARTFPTNADGDREREDVSLSETWERMESLIDRELVRTLGLCNVSLEQLETLVASAHVLPAIVQIESHPYRPQTELVRACHELGIRVMAHSPLSATGLLDEPILDSIARSHDVSPATIVLAWHRERGVVPIPSSNDPEHIVSNLAAGRLRLTDGDSEQVDTLADPAFER